jgi:large subunit ribosomal protein L3
MVGGISYGSGPSDPSKALDLESPVSIQLLCRKLGMTQIFAENGDAVSVTVLEAGPNSVVQKKTVESDGYSALQLGYGERRPIRTSKGALGHFQKANTAPRQFLKESRVTPEEAAAHEPGGTITVEIFAPGQRVDVIGISKGRGTAGVVRRHHFPDRAEAHGAHERFRHGGSIGPGTYPGHVIKGLRMPGRMGNERATVLNLEVVKVDAERGLLYIRGAVPGYRSALIRVRPTVA